MFARQAFRSLGGRVSSRGNRPFSSSFVSRRSPFLPIAALAGISAFTAYSILKHEPVYAAESKEEAKSVPAKKIEMQYRRLGNTGLWVSVLSLGSWLTVGSQVAEDLAFECVKTAYENGINFFDNAEAYAGGEAEIVFGRVLKRLGAKRSDLVISTKIFWGGKGPNDVGLSRKHVIEGVDAALKRLQLDYVDIVFCHRPDPHTPIEETVRAMNHVINTGKAFYWGTSEWEADEIREAHAVADRLGLIPPCTEQPQYNLIKRQRVERDYLTLFKEKGMGVTIWSPLASGVLTAKHINGIAQGSRLAEQKWLQEEVLSGSRYGSKEQLDANLIKLQPIAKKLDCTLAQLAIAWCVKNNNVSTVITGASKPEQVIENIQALEVVPKLTPAILDEIEKIFQNKPAPLPDRTGRKK